MCRLLQVRFFAGRVASKAKFHVSIGHSTVMAEALAFGLPDGQGVPPDQALQMMLDNLNALSLHGVQAQPSVAFSMDREYLYQEELYGLEGRPLGSGSEAPGAGEAATSSGGPGVGGEDAGGAHFGQQWLLLKFDQPVTAPADAMVIGARFDADAHAEGCRLAFYGRAVATLSNASDPAELRRLKLFKLKERSGVLDRIQADGTSAICRGLLKKESDVTIFTGAPPFPTSEC